MASGWLIFLGLLNVYVLFLIWLVRSGRMEKWNLSLLLGFILMIRTQRGKGLLDKIARPRRFWNVFGDLGTVVTLVGMVLMTVYLFFAIFFQVRSGETGVALGAREILIIPGVTPWLPIGYGILALIITLVVHEGGHGVLARANDLKVKSLGLLFAIVPVGAFVEPDEEELNKARRRDRLRVFSAGVMVNLVVALLVLVAFAGMAAALRPVEGVGIQQVTVDMPAEQAGMRPGDILVSADGAPIVDWQDFNDFMGDQAPGDEVRFGLRDGRELDVVLASRWDSLDDEARSKILAYNEAASVAYCDRFTNASSGQECAQGLQEDPMLGVSAYNAQQWQGFLSQPFGGGGIHFLILIGLPLSEILGGEPILSALPMFFSTPWDGTAVEWLYFPLAFTLFWVFWINLMVGLTNILPMLPLDGGHIFRDAVGGIVQRVRPRMEAPSVDRAVGLAAGAMSIVMLLAIITTFALPHLIGRFG